MPSERSLGETASTNSTSIFFWRRVQSAEILFTCLHYSDCFHRKFILPALFDVSHPLPSRITRTLPNPTILGAPPLSCAQVLRLHKPKQTPPNLLLDKHSAAQIECLFRHSCAWLTRSCSAVRGQRGAVKEHEEMYASAFAEKTSQLEKFEGKGAK